ncbi:MAG: TolC family protein [Muribaculaceae bacterium]|nr:TolC family protein [Muribaculaceae bacterium]MDE6754162.1 TolC family protein [Muribaculaceae bacterium]
MRFLLKFLSSSVFLASLALPALANNSSDTLRLSRTECIKIALQDNPTVRVADLEVKKMDYAKKEVIGSLFPSIDFSLSYQRSIELQSLSMNMGGQSSTIKMGTDNNWNTGFSAAMPLINPTLWKSINISDTQILAALEQSRGSRIDLVNNLNKAYYALLLAIDSRDVIHQNFDVAKMNADIYRKQFEQGTASEYDVLRSSVQVTNIEPELLQADIAIRQCQLQLKVLMGIDSSAEVWPDISLYDLKRDMYGLPEGFDKGIGNNTSLRELDINKKLLEQNVALRKLAWLPTLGVQFNLNWNAMSNGNALRNQTFNPYSNVALALSLPIFSGGKKLYALRQAQVQLTEMKFQRENLVNSLNMQVELAVDNINRQVRQIAASEEGMKQAAKAYDIMQKSFEIGAATYLNLRDSELANTSARLSYLQAIYNYLVSTSELNALLGKDETGEK